MSLYQSKEVVNAAEDAQGRLQAMQTSFALIKLAHRHWLKLCGMLLDPVGFHPRSRRVSAQRWREHRSGG